MPRDAVSRTANVERNGGQKWVNLHISAGILTRIAPPILVKIFAEVIRQFIRIPMTLASTCRLSVNFFSVFHWLGHTQRNFFENLLNQSEIRLYIAFSN